MPIQRNRALDVPFALVNTLDGSLVTGASVTAYRCLDGGVQSVADGSVSELGSGQYVFEGDATDFNAESNVGLLFIAANAIPAHILLQIRFFRKDVAYNIPFVLIDVRTGSPLTGANPFVLRCLDGGIQEGVDGSVVERGNGQYVFQAAATDFEAEEIAAFLITANYAVPVHLCLDLLELYAFGTETVDTPASILATLLMELGVLDDPDVAGDWPVYISHMPDQPDDVVAIYDTTPLKDARIMGNSIVEHPGVMFSLRTCDYPTGWVKMVSIAAALDDILRTQVTCGSRTYKVQAVSRAGGPVALGVEEGTKRRNLFSLNVITSITQL